MTLYDLVLVALALPLAGAVAVGAATAVAMTTALAVGSAVSAVPLSYALFVDPPTAPSG